MIKIWAKILFLGLMVTCRLQNALAGYGKVDKYLLQTVDSDNVDLNINAAEEWLTRNSNLKKSFLTRDPTEDFRTFVALKQVLGENKCTEASYKIMRENELNIGDLFIKVHSDSVKRRIDKVVSKIFEQHASSCQDVWPVILKQKLSRIEDQSKLVRGGILAEAILLETLGGKTVSRPKQLYDMFIGNLLEIKDLRRSRSIYQKLIEFAKEDSDLQFLQPVVNEKTGKKSVRSDKIKDLVGKYLVEPCSYLVDQLGPDIFIPARWDATTLPPNSGDIQFYAYWTDFRICEVVAKNSEKLSKDLMRVIERKT